MFHLDDRYLKEAEREARQAGRVLEDEVLPQKFSTVISQWREKEAERQLILAAKGGDAERFAELVRRYWNRVYCICYGFTWNIEEAEDLAQEVFEKVWIVHDRLSLDGNMEAYFAKTAENHCKDWLRKEKRQGSLAWSQMESTDEIVEDEEGSVSVVIDGIADPTAIDPGEQVLLKVAVERTMQQLSPIHQEVLRTRFVLGYSRAEIAEQEGCTEQTVGNHERRAMAQFREHFLKEWGDIDTEGGNIR